MDRGAAAFARGVRRAAIALGMGVALATSLPAQVAPSPPAEQRVPGSELSVYLVTIGQGALVWERFGHNALWIHDAARGTDAAYNWGIFSFDEPGFMSRFVRGRMMYWMGAFDAGEMIQSYIRDDRPVWVQELRLTPAQRLELHRFVEWNRLPQNRYYRYDYFLDNCSTRVRDALDRVLGGLIEATTDTIPSGTTYRWHTRRLLAEDLPIYTGTLYGLGQPADAPISLWEEMYLPMQMRETLRSIRVPDESGALVPLVVAERAIYQGNREPELEAPPSYLPLFLFAGLVLGGAMLVLGVRTSGRASRASFASLAAVWCAVSGLLGLFVVLVWLLTDHVFAYRNLNVLQMSPVALPLLVLLPRAVLRGRGTGAVRALALAVAALSALGLVLQVLPSVHQVNGEIIALALPANIGLALGAHRATRAADARAVA